MSIELRLYPIEREARGIIHASAGITLARYAALFHEIRRIPRYPVRSFFLQGRTVPVDGYERPLFYTLASGLIDAAEGMVLAGVNATTWERLGQLDPTTKIVLYWH